MDDGLTVRGFVFPGALYFLAPMGADLTLMDDLPRFLMGMFQDAATGHEYAAVVVFSDEHLAERFIELNDDHAAAYEPRKFASNELLVRYLAKAITHEFFHAVVDPEQHHGNVVHLGCLLAAAYIAAN